MNEYKGFIPPCGIYCGQCPNYLREKNRCQGAEEHCKKRMCKTIYICCKEKRNHNFCYECNIFPCNRIKKFSQSWTKLGQDLIVNQQQLKELGEAKWLEKWIQRKD